MYIGLQMKVIKSLLCLFSGGIKNNQDFALYYLPNYLGKGKKCFVLFCFYFS